MLSTQVLTGFFFIEGYYARLFYVISRQCCSSANKPYLEFLLLKIVDFSAKEQWLDIDIYIQNSLKRTKEQYNRYNVSFAISYLKWDKEHCAVLLLCLFLYC